MVLAAVIVLLRLTTVPVAGQASSSTAWGHPNLEGIWLDVYATPLERNPALGDREFATGEERAERDQARIGLAPAPGRSFERGERGSAQDVSSAYNAVFTSVKPAGPRTSLIVDPPNGRLPALTAEAKRKQEVQLEWRQALMQNTPTCEQGARGCEGGEYGPPSPRRFDVPPFYNTQRMNRHDGPEDQSLSDRCMGGGTPNFNGFRRIVQGDDSIAIGYDTGQGQGFQRIINLSGNHPPSQVSLRHGDSRGHWEGQTLVIETTNFSPKFTLRPARGGFYFKTNPVYSDTYDTPDWRQLLMCQEIGHDFGLDHQDENFNNANLGTCMDYTSDPSTNTEPNAHDMQQLKKIYRHKDGGGGGGGGKPCRGPAWKCSGSQTPPPAFNMELTGIGQWGQLVRTSRDGGRSTFVQDFGNEHHVYTHVTWTLDIAEQLREGR